jgi:hypothetical protein
MTALTDGTLRNDDELIGILQRVAVDGSPPLRRDIDQLLAKGRRARNRRRVLMAPASGLAVAGLAAIVFAAADAGSDQPQVFLSPSASATQDSSHSTAHSDTNRQVLQEAFGGDFTIGPESETGPTPGNVTVRPGSPSAEGLPTGVTLWTQLLAGSPGGIPATDLEQFCAPIAEKGLHTSECIQYVLPSGQVVHVQRGRYNPGEYKPASRRVLLPSDSVRVIYAQSNGQLVIVDLVASEDESSSTSEERTAVNTWLDGMTPRLATAATDPRVDAMWGVEGEPKGGARPDERRAGTRR